MHPIFRFPKLPIGRESEFLDMNPFSGIGIVAPPRNSWHHLKSASSLEKKKSYRQFWVVFQNAREDSFFSSDGTPPETVNG